ncbi:MAG: hypothetical protein QHC67_18655 [Sphingobium sp.]|nr:hypothetical protein [Sphingobium sp.]MDX3911794.1 hypothetical protein [Sphingobium sp.]
MIYPIAKIACGLATEHLGEEILARDQAGAYANGSRLSAQRNR